MGNESSNGLLAVTSSGTDLKALVDPRFGRCLYFVIFDQSSNKLEAVRNVAAAQGSGAGIQAAQEIVDRKVTSVITGEIGPNAHRVLSAAGIDVYVGGNGTVEKAISDWRSGNLPLAAGPTRPGHHGQGPMHGPGGPRWESGR